MYIYIYIIWCVDICIYIHIFCIYIYYVFYVCIYNIELHYCTHLYISSKDTVWGTARTGWNTVRAALATSMSCLTAALCMWGSRLVEPSTQQGQRGVYCETARMIHLRSQSWPKYIWVVLNRPIYSALASEHPTLPSKETCLENQRMHVFIFSAAGNCLTFVCRLTFLYKNRMNEKTRSLDCLCFLWLLSSFWWWPERVRNSSQRRPAAALFSPCQFWRPLYDLSVLAFLVPIRRSPCNTSPRSTWAQNLTEPTFPDSEPCATEALLWCFRALTCRSLRCCGYISKLLPQHPPLS